MPDRISNDQPVRKAIDSTVMLVLARFFMPAVVAVLGYFLTTTLDDLKRANREVWVQINKFSDNQAAANVVQAGVVSRLDDASKRLDRLQGQVDSLAKH